MTADGRFLPKPAKELLQNMEFKKVPLITGVNDDEGFMIMKVSESLSSSFTDNKNMGIKFFEEVNVCLGDDSHWQNKNIFPQFMPVPGWTDGSERKQALSAMSFVFPDVSVDLQENRMYTKTILSYTNIIFVIRKTIYAHHKYIHTTYTACKHKYTVENIF